MNLGENINFEGIKELCEGFKIHNDLKLINIHGNNNNENWKK